jgi:Tol biopolymer transport system component/TolA-binding protein
MERIFLILILCLGPMIMATGQEQQAGKLLSQAIYQEEVNGELDEAIKTYRLIVEQYPDNRKVSAEALLHLGICYEKIGKPQAYDTYKDIIDKYAEQQDEVALAQKRMDHLIAYADDINEKAVRHMNKGNELFKLWEYESAIKEFEIVIELRPNTLLAQNALYNIGQSYYKAGLYEEALTTLINLIEENPESSITPVSELMVIQVQNAILNNTGSSVNNDYSNEDRIVDPETGITYRKIKTFTGRNDVIDWASGTKLSPNGKFLLKGNTIVPMDGSEPFKFFDMQVSEPEWSPDGKNIAFTNGDSSIYMVPVSPETGHATGTPENLLKREGRCSISGVNWSPDCKKLFFHMINHLEKDYPEIFSLSISDGVINSLTTENIPQFNPACSPDGNTIAFNGPFKSLWLCPEEGGAANKLIDDKHTKPHWTPDGKWLFSDETRKGWGRSLNFIQLSDKVEFKITPPVKTGSYLSMSPEGNKVLFYRPSHQLFWGMKVASASGGPSYEPVSHLPVYGAQWSKNSKIIIIQGEKYNKMEEGDAAIRIVPIAGGESFLLNMDVDVKGKPFAYCSTPDQKRLLFKVTKEDESEDLYMVPVSIEDARVTDPPTRIIENWIRNGAHNTKMALSADGTKLALIHNEDIWIYNMDEKDLKQITKTPEKKKWVAWSPDSRMLSYWAFVDTPDWEIETRIISSDSGKPIKTLNNCMVFPFGWSPDSKSVVMFQNDELILRNIFTDEISVILDLNTHWLNDIGNYCWSPDGKYLVIDGREEAEPDTKYHLLKIPVDGGEITELATDDVSFKYDISWSHDGKWICYCFMEMEKTRPESTLWEADFNEILEKLQ